jgi:hypothetical protein
VGETCGTYVRKWENVEGGLGEVGVPWEVGNEEMKGKMQYLMEREGALRSKCQRDAE